MKMKNETGAATFGWAKNNFEWENQNQIESKAK